MFKRSAENVITVEFSSPVCHIFHTPSITSLAPLYMGREIIQILHSLTEGTFVLRVKVFIQMKLLLVHYNYSESFMILKVHNNSINLPVLFHGRGKTVVKILGI